MRTADWVFLVLIVLGLFAPGAPDGVSTALGPLAVGGAMLAGKLLQGLFGSKAKNDQRKANNAALAATQRGVDANVGRANELSQGQRDVIINMLTGKNPDGTPTVASYAEKYKGRLTPEVIQMLLTLPGKSSLPVGVKQTGSFGSDFLQTLPGAITSALQAGAATGLPRPMSVSPASGATPGLPTQAVVGDMQRGQFTMFDPFDPDRDIY